MMTACNVDMTAAEAPYFWVLYKHAIISRYILGNLHWDVDQRYRTEKMREGCHHEQSNARKYMAVGYCSQLTLLAIRSAYNVKKNINYDTFSDTITVASDKFKFTLQANYLTGHTVLAGRIPMANVS